jgi:hypothetical protein
MIEMAMGIEEVAGGEPVRLDKMGQVLFFRGKITAGVYNTAVPFFVVHNIGILLYRVECKWLNS